jgi:hypothetical protein
MIKTMQPGEGDEFSREYEVEMLNRMLEVPFIETRRAEASRPIGRRILEAEVFGTGEYLTPFEFPKPYSPIRRETGSNN